MYTLWYARILLFHFSMTDVHIIYIAVAHPSVVHSALREVNELCSD